MIFHSYVSLPEGIPFQTHTHTHCIFQACRIFRKVAGSNVAHISHRGPAVKGWFPGRYMVISPAIIGQKTGALTNKYWDFLIDGDFLKWGYHGNVIHLNRIVPNKHVQTIQLLGAPSPWWSQMTQLESSSDSRSFSVCFRRCQRS